MIYLDMASPELRRALASGEVFGGLGMTITDPVRSCWAVDQGDDARGTGSVGLGRAGAHQPLLAPPSSVTVRRGENSRGKLRLGAWGRFGGANPSWQPGAATVLLAPEAAESPLFQP
jgi:hypothetical protein